MPQLPTRPLADVQAAIRAVGARRHTHVVDRDRRNADMLRALRDVEDAEQKIARCDAELENLFDEHNRARQQQPQP